MGQRRENRLLAPGIASLPVTQHVLDFLTLQVFLRAAQVAGDDREAPACGVRCEILFPAVGERADHHVVAVVAEQFRRHRLQLAAEEHVEEQRLDDVVAVVPERDPGGADLAREAVQVAPATEADQHVDHAFAAEGRSQRHARSRCGDDFADDAAVGAPRVCAHRRQRDRIARGGMADERHSAVGRREDRVGVEIERRRRCGRPVLAMGRQVDGAGAVT